jgi:DNA transposition AAA+ family ATPase
MKDKLRDFLIAQDARIVEVRMPENLESIQRVAEELVGFIDKHGLTQVKVAKAIGVSPTQISQFIKGDYPGDVLKLAAKLVSFINTYEGRARQAGNGGFVETTVARAIFGVIKQVEYYCEPSEGKIGLIVGDSGHGKSKCLMAYAESNPNSIYLKLNDTMSGQAMFQAIAEKLGIDISGTFKTMLDRISRCLKSRVVTLLLDEASALDVKRLNQLRQIVVENGCALILAGNDYLLKTINQSSVKRGYESLDQFRSRMLGALNLDAKVKDDGPGGLYTLEDIRKLYEYGGIRLVGGADKTLQKICQTPQTGRLRTCSLVIKKIHNSRQIRNGDIKEIDPDMILEAIGLLNLLVADRLPFIIDAIAAKDQVEVAVKTA